MSSINRLIVSPVASEGYFSDYDYVDVNSTEEIARRVFLAKEDFAELKIPPSRKNSFSSVDTVSSPQFTSHQVSLEVFLKKCLQSVLILNSRQVEITLPPTEREALKPSRHVVSLEKSQDHFIYRLIHDCSNELEKGKDFEPIEERCRWGLSLESSPEAKSCLANFLVHVLIKRHMFAAAEELARTYLQQPLQTSFNVTQPALRDGLLEALNRQCKYGEVEALAKKFLELAEPLDAKVIYGGHLSSAQYSLERYEEVVITTQFILHSTFPSFDNKIAHLLCCAKNKLGDFEEGEKISQFYLSQSSENFKADFANQIAIALMHRGEYESALETVCEHLDKADNYDTRLMLILTMAEVQNKLGDGKASFHLLSPLLADFDYIKIVSPSLRHRLFYLFDEAISQSSLQPSMEY